MTSRRAFLKSVFAASALPATGASGERYWEMVRRQFPFSESRVPLNAGNLCPSPRVVSEQVEALTQNIDHDVSYTNRAKFAGLLEDSRAKVAEHLRANPDEIALVRNTSEANSTVITGLELGPGDEVVLWSENHPTNNVAWDVQAKRLGFDVRRVDTPKPLARVFTDALSARTRVLALSHLSNYSGVLLPVDVIAAAARERGIFVLIDGAQTWGALDVDVSAIGCDVYTASAHKWLCGPKEAGVLFVRRERIAAIHAHYGGVWLERRACERRARRAEIRDTRQRDDPCLASIKLAVDFHLAIGRARIDARVRELASALKEGLHEAGLPLLTPRESELSGGVCTVEVPREKRRALVFALDARGVAGSPAGGLRLCPHLYNTKAHVERTVEAVASLSSMIRA